jgi:hypothetical protein
MSTAIYGMQNGYAEQLVQKIFGAYSEYAYLNSQGIHALKREGTLLTNVSSFDDNVLTFTGMPITLSFRTTLIKDNSLPNGAVKFSGKHPDYRLLFADNQLPSGRIERIALITENGQYIAI